MFENQTEQNRSWFFIPSPDYSGVRRNGLRQANTRGSKGLGRDDVLVLIPGKSANVRLVMLHEWNQGKKKSSRTLSRDLAES
jgi:hypothetical protein